LRPAVKVVSDLGRLPSTAPPVLHPLHSSMKLSYRRAPVTAGVSRTPEERMRRQSYSATRPAGVRHAPLRRVRLSIIVALLPGVHRDARPSPWPQRSDLWRSRTARPRRHSTRQKGAVSSLRSIVKVVSALGRRYRQWLRLLCIHSCCSPPARFRPKHPPHPPSTYQGVSSQGFRPNRGM